MTATCMVKPKLCFRPASRSEETGDAMPSCARFVATATRGRPGRPGGRVAGARREVRRDGAQRQAAEAGGVLGDVERAAAADGHQRIVETASESLAEPKSGLEGAATNHPDVGVRKVRPGRVDDLLAQPWANRKRNVAPARDPAIREQRPEALRRTRANVDRQRGADHARQQRHASSRARARSVWSSTSTHPTAPTDAAVTRPPRSANAWNPSS